MAEFYAYRIICNKTKYSKVPKALKENVKEILIEEGFASLTQE